nr:hypothetical protein [uncultured bacterium]
MESEGPVADNRTYDDSHDVRRAGMSSNVDAPPLWCPRCRRVVGDAARCPVCGLPQTGESAARLRHAVGRLHAIGEQQRALDTEAAGLRREQAELLRVLVGQERLTLWGVRPGRPRRPDPGAPPGRGTPRAAPESRPEVVRDVLLWLGSALVAVAALTFALFAWRRLGDTGRASLLFGATLLAAMATIGTLRRLPATAEALAGLTLALFLVDWFVLRRAGVAGDLSAPAWWALGTGMAAGLSAAAARWLRLQSVAAAVLVQISAVLTVTRVAEAGWTIALGLALVAVPLATVAGRLGRDRAWVPAAVVLASGAALMELVALGVVDEEFRLDDWSTSVRLATVLAVMALAPAGARLTVAPTTKQIRLDGLVATSVGCVLGAISVLLAAAFSSSTALLAVVAVLGAATVGLVRAVPGEVRAGTLYAAGAALGVAVLGLAQPVVMALGAPLSWLSEPWGTTLGRDAVLSLTPTYAGDDLAFVAALVALLAVALAAGLAIAPVGQRRLVPPLVAPVTGAAAAIGLVATAPLAAGLPVWAATLITALGALGATGAAALADRRDWRVPSLVLAGAAILLGATATGWALATEAGTIAFLGAVAVVAAAATGLSRTPPFRQTLGAVASVALIGESASVAISAGATPAVVGFVIAMAGGAVLVAGALGRKGEAEGIALEAAGGAGMFVGALLAAVEDPLLAITLTASVPWLMAAGSRPIRHQYLWAGASTAVAATWAWLAFADVTLVEAYTLPAAVVALAAGFDARRRMTELSSWPALGPGLAIGIVPSLGLVLAQGGLARPLALSLASLLVLLAGAKVRLQAPLVLGAGTLLVLALDVLWPVAAQLPRWVTIGTAGILLLWLGATAEHRLTQLREVGRRFQELEPDGPLGSPT